MDSDLAWVNGKSGRQSWRYANAFQRYITSEAIYHFTIYVTDNRQQMDATSWHNHNRQYGRPKNLCYLSRK